MMDTEYNQYAFEKSQHYTEQMVELARQRWGDIPLSPQTYTWSDGTISVIVEHNVCDAAYPTQCQTVRLNFQETGFRGYDAPMIRESVDEGVGSDGRVVWSELEFACEWITMY